MAENIGTKKHFENLDGIRALSCLGIILMHIRANSSYAISGKLYDVVIPNLTWLVYLFIMLSSFGMCCGYQRRFEEKTIDLEQFYKRRFAKMLPFFSILVLMSVVYDRTRDAIFEGIMECSLLFGLLPNNEMDTLGVSWTLGVIFLFYMLFPFFSFIFSNKRRSCLYLVLSIVICWLCDAYFFTTKFVVDGFTPRHSFLYCMPFFLLGGVLYQHRDNLESIAEKFRFVLLAVCCGYTVAWFFIPDALGVNIFGLKTLILFGLWIVYGMGKNSILLTNKGMKFICKISFELYLAQMIAFRLFEKIVGLYVLGTGVLSLLFTCVSVLAIDIILVLVINKCLDIAMQILGKVRG